jgi:hypothetical protein
MKKFLTGAAALVMMGAVGSFSAFAQDQGKAPASASIAKVFAAAAPTATEKVEPNWRILRFETTGFEPNNAQRMAALLESERLGIQNPTVTGTRTVIYEDGAAATIPAASLKSAMAVIISGADGKKSVFTFKDSEDNRPDVLKLF